MARTDPGIYRREFYREQDHRKAFKDFKAEPEFAQQNFVDFFGKTWLPTHSQARSLDDVLRPFYNDSRNESKNIFFRVFAVSDGSLVQHTPENDSWLRQGIRFITLVAGFDPAPGDGDAQPFKTGCWTLCVVGSSEITSNTNFLQVASWDGTRFRYYSRDVPNTTDQEPSAWIFQGDSTLAFGSQSYLGPFNGHVNGSLVMKELRKPWLHWLVAGNGFVNRMALSFLQTFEQFPYLSDPDDHNATNEGLGGAMLSKISSANELENSITSGINKWYDNRRRLDFLENNQPKMEVSNIKRWLAHTLLTTTVNIISATNNQTGTRPGNIFDIPISHFYNVDVFGNTAAKNVQPTISVSNGFIFDEQAYAMAIDKLGIALVNRCPPSSDPQPDYTKHPKIGQVPIHGVSAEMFIVQPGEGQDVFFTMLQPSYEDTQGVVILLNMKTPILSKSCIQALLMVDPYNPIYSWRRGVLMQYVPDNTTLSGPYDPKNSTPQTYDLEAKLEAAVRASPRFKDESSPEREFITNLELQRAAQQQPPPSQNPTPEPGPALDPEPPISPTYPFATKMNTYLTSITARLTNDPVSSLQDYMLLAESRRRIYRPVPLDEFALTLPWAINYPSNRPIYEMKPDGTIAPVPRRGRKFLERWIGSLASYDPQIIPRPDADDNDDDDSGDGDATGDGKEEGGIRAVFSLKKPAVLNISCEGSVREEYRLGGGCPYFGTKREREG